MQMNKNKSNVKKQHTKKKTTKNFFFLLVDDMIYLSPYGILNVLILKWAKYCTTCFYHIFFFVVSFVCVVEHKENPFEMSM